MAERRKSLVWIIGLLMAGPVIALLCLLPLLFVRFDSLDGTQYLLAFATLLAIPVCWLAALVLAAVVLLRRLIARRRVPFSSRA
ncbi:uncharacterized membrane protein YhaH (DUF805 family) [Microbacterium resistens]|uniref:Uncharacterized membrane protein YhaH (DUF805 family) n=1 Tax=Microbacterium resistens TaxID=156977 RepID=A0ABU1SH58_9MICO|nr:hypothetical protein [Microbacterium resistens]MDR6868933.1 uncharacterized membrane protein YhaH (DUF805 family) [Microbacterium resistens]